MFDNILKQLNDKFDETSLIFLYSYAIFVKYFSFTVYFVYLFLFVIMEIGVNHNTRTVYPIHSKPSTRPTLLSQRKPTLLFLESASGSKQPRKALNFYESIKSEIITSRIFGLTPFTLDLDSSGNPEKTSIGVFDGIWFIGSIAINLMFSYLVLDSLAKSNADTESPVLHLSEWFFNILGISLWVISIVLDMVNRNRFIKIIRDFMVLDKKVMKVFFVSTIKIRRFINNF